MSKLPASLLTILLLLPYQYAMANPAWIEKASRPGPDIAPVGQSRFDQLFLQPNGSYQIPYPFERLIEALEKQLDNGDNPAVRQVLVPIGRSLQRESPAPEYFRFPRNIITLEGEPITVGRQPGQVMEYRLFIAHQPDTETLEIISYNDAAGRFEFQLAEDYSAGKPPRVKSARRVMCMSCHHNAAPIFSRTPWSETSFNIEVANRLAAALPHRFSSPIEVVSLDAGVIDVLAERANYLSAAQAIWRRGCDSAACRAAMLRAMLQYRLSGKSNYDASTTSYQRDYLDRLSRNWKRQWPRGLALAGSRLPDRNPFAAETFENESDPLLRRPPQATWHGVDSALASGIVYRLAGFFSDADIRRLDRHLTAAESAASTTYRHRASCTTRADGADRYRLLCGDKSALESLQAEFEAEVSAGDIVSLRFLSLRVPLDSNLLQPDIVEPRQKPGRLEARLVNGQHRLSMRLANGNRIESMTLSWGDSLLRGQSKLELVVTAEFEIIDQALSKLLDRHRSGQADSLGEGVFERKAILRELMQELGMDSLDWPPTVARAVAAQRPAGAGLNGDLALLAPYCAHCHADDSRHPPGFLYGKAPVELVLQCAPRILRRLQAWREGGEFAPSPMPPSDSIEFSGIEAEDWPLSDHYRKLVDSLEQLLIQQQGRQRLLDWQQTDYARLPPCLPGLTNREFRSAFGAVDFVQHHFVDAGIGGSTADMPDDPGDRGRLSL